MVPKRPQQGPGRLTHMFIVVDDCDHWHAASTFQTLVRTEVDIACFDERGRRAASTPSIRQFDRPLTAKIAELSATGLKPVVCPLPPARSRSARPRR